jgi:DNA polymerase-3 subunit delta
MIFFFYGPNTYESRSQIAKLINQFKKKSGNDFGIDRIDGDKSTIAELKASLHAVPFLAASRLVIIESLGRNKAVASKIEDLIDGIPSTTVAVFYDPDVDHRTNYFKTLKDKSKVVEFKQLDHPKLMRWIINKVEDDGGEIDRAAVGRLLDLAGEDQWRLSNEIEKLINYNNEVTVENIDLLVESSRTESIFNLVDAMSAGKRQLAIQIYTRLRTNGESEMYILSMIIWQLRNQLLAKSAGRITAPQLAKEAGMSPYVAGKVLATRHLYTEDRIKESFIRAIDTEMAIKTGEGDGDYLVEQLVSSLSGATS